MTILADEGDTFWCGLSKWATGKYACEFCAYTCRGTDLPEEEAKRLFCKHVNLGPPKSPTTGKKMKNSCELEMVTYDVKDKIAIYSCSKCSMKEDLIIQDDEGHPYPLHLVQEQYCENDL